MNGYQIIDPDTGTELTEVRELAAWRVVPWALEIARESGLGGVDIRIVRPADEQTVTLVSLGMTKAELIDTADRLGIAVPAKATKAEIVDALRQHETT